MSRDDALPGSRYLSKVHKGLHTPILACVVVGLLSAIPFIQYAGVAIIAIAATGMIYLSYLIGNVALFRARLRGWPKTKAPFSLGRWGLPLTVLALLYGGGMFLNMLWPRAATNPRPATEAPAPSTIFRSPPTVPPLIVTAPAITCADISDAIDALTPATLVTAPLVIFT